MFYWMVSNQCDVADTLNDFMVYCWYEGCWPRQILLESFSRILYVARAINDAAILWTEQMPKADTVEGMLEATKKYETVAEKVGSTIAEIVKDLTGFEPIPKEKRV